MRATRCSWMKTNLEALNNGRSWYHQRRNQSAKEVTLIIKGLAVGPIQANCYILGCPRTQEAAVIDPGAEGERILQLLRQQKLNLTTIIDTHGHFDHVGANKQLKEATGAQLLIHPLDAPMLSQLVEAAALFGMTAENSPPPDRTVEEGDMIQVGELSLQVIHTPGHTPGGISLYTNNSVFVGDTLFAGSVGRTDFPGGSADTLKASIQRKLFPLGDDVVVYPGHMGSTTLGQERLSNPFVGEHGIL